MSADDIDYQREIIGRMKEQKDLNLGHQTQMNIVEAKPPMEGKDGYPNSWIRRHCAAEIGRCILACEIHVCEVELYRVPSRSED